MRLAPLLALAACAAPQRPVDPGVHRRALVIDAHDDITEAIVYGSYDFAARHDATYTHTDLPRLREGGVDAEIFAIWLDPDLFPADRMFAEAEHELVAARAKLAAVPGIALARTAAEIRDNKQRGMISALFGVEGGYMLAPGTDAEVLAHLRRFAELGVRYLTLTHSKRSPLGGSSGDESDGEGLTELGRASLAELERLGIVVDLSHVSDPLFWDAIRAAKKPVIASHSSARTLANVPRNMSDAMLKAVAKNGGAVCVNFFPGFLDARTRKDLDRVNAAIEKRGGPKPKSIVEDRQLVAAYRDEIQVPDLAVLADHIVHISQVAGIDHVCLGSDFDGIPFGPRGVEDVSKMPAVTAELLRRGFSEADVAKVLGGNLLRVLEAAERGMEKP